MPIESLPPIAIVSSQWQGFPFTGGSSQWRNVDELMASIDESDWNRQILNNRTIKYVAGKLANTGPVNSIKMAMNVKRYRTQGHASLRLNVFLAGQRVVPESEISVDAFVNYNAIQIVWPAASFLAPWVGLTGQQWNDEIDLDPNAAQYWTETFSSGFPPPEEPETYTEE